MSDCSATIYGHRVHSWGCTRKGVVERKGKWYCRLHDPEAIKTRENAKNAQRKAERAAEDAIEREGQRLAKALGYGSPYYRVSFRGYNGWTRELVISFDDVEKLVERLAAGPHVDTAK